MIAFEVQGCVILPLKTSSFPISRNLLHHKSNRKQFLQNDVQGWVILPLKNQHFEAHFPRSRNLLHHKSNRKQFLQDVVQGCVILPLKTGFLKLISQDHTTFYIIAVTKN